jgi:hypothetical protein
MDVLCLFGLLERQRFDLLCGYLLEFQLDLVVSSRLVDINPQADNRLEDVQFLLFVQELALLDLVLGGFVIGHEIFLIDGGQVRIIEVIGDLLFIDDLLALLGLYLVLLKLLALGWLLGGLCLLCLCLAFHYIK